MRRGATRSERSVHPALPFSQPPGMFHGRVPVASVLARFLTCLLRLGFDDAKNFLVLNLDWRRGTVLLQQSNRLGMR